MKRRIIVILMLVALVVLLTGCTMDPKSIEELSNGNFFFSTFVYPLALLLGWLHDILWNQYGLAILALTIIIRLLVLPLAIKQYKSMKGMQKIQPQIRELQQKYKDDKQQLQMEMMKLMQENNVNPAAGCLPLLIQMPILIALYYAINTDDVVGDPARGIEGETFLGIFELGKVDGTYILPILAAITTIIPMLITARTTPSQPQMKIMMFIFPPLIFLFSYQLPSALPLYWVYSNIFTIIQTYFLYREPKEKLAVAVANANGAGETDSSSQSTKPKANKKKKNRWK